MRETFARRPGLSLLNRLLCTGLMSVSGALLAQPSTVQAVDRESHPGAAEFQQHCSSCHENAEMSAVPTLEYLKTLSAAALEFAINEGVMYGQAATLSNSQKALIVDYLAAEQDDSWLQALMCEERDRSVNLTADVSWSQHGVDSNNSRNLDAIVAALADLDASRELELAWAIGFPDIGALRAGPVIVGSTLFYSATGTRHVLALDAATGCAKWAFKSPTRLRSSLSYGSLGDNGAKALLYGDAEGFAYALDALTGEQLWRADVRSHGRGVRLTGGLVLHEDLVLVPVSASGVSQGGNPNFECCIGHGEIVALDAATGSVRWVYHTMPEAEYTGAVNSIGVKLRGPSGAPIWTTPTVDAKRQRVYVTTGENTSHPATVTSDAVIALDLNSGEELWVFQALPHDVWNTACGREPGPNCPNQAPSVLADKDFGGSAILIQREEGDILLAGQKTGDLWALDAESGSLLWNQRIGSGTALGGNHWGISSDGNRVFHPINDPGSARGTYIPRPGVYSFFVDSGEPSWSHQAQASCDQRASWLRGCSSRFGMSAAPLLVGNTLIIGGLDGRLYLFDKQSGDILQEVDTVQQYQTVNDVPAQGGSIDAHSIAAGAGMVFVGSGYGRVGGTPGNTLLAFRPKAR